MLNIFQPHREKVIKNGYHKNLIKIRPIVTQFKMYCFELVLWDVMLVRSLMEEDFSVNV